MMGAPCESCGHVHASRDARAVGRFGSNVTYVAATAPTPQRSTRAEAEADECEWRRERTPTKPFIDPSPSSRPLVVVEQPAIEPVPFPSEAMETAARAKAWRDFLAEIRLSLMVWEIDGDVRSGCEDVLAWIGRCRDDLNALGGLPDA